MKKIVRESKNQGITLVALVITIIVLTILAGITLTAFIDENKGIINQSNNARSDTEIADWKERIDVAIVKAEGKYMNPTLDNIIQELIEDEIISNASQVDKETGAITTNEPSYVIEGKLDDYLQIEVADEKTVEDLKAGEKVYYDTGDTSVGTNGIIECVVLYDTEYNETKGTNYGVQIVASDTVGNDVTLGDRYFETAKDSYNNAITTLNAKAEEYVNSTYASDARCVGSVPNNKNSEATENWYIYSGHASIYFLETDTNYETDYEQMGSENLNIANIGVSYWLASRIHHNAYHSSGDSFDIRSVSTSGSLSFSELCRVYSYGSWDYYSVPQGFRPVFTLKPGIKITGGDGINTPYTLAP